MTPTKRTSSDSRNRKRITKVLPVDCTVVDLPNVRVDLMEGSTFGGRTVNLSKTGIQIHSDYELDPKTVVDVVLSLDAPARRKVTVRVEVAWAKKNAIDLYGRWRMGMHIVKAKAIDLEDLHDYFDAVS